MRNPFEEKRKNDRINRLVKENEALSKQLAEQTSELDSLRLQESIWQSIAETNKILKDEVEKLNLEFKFYKAGEVAGMRELEAKNHRYEKALKNIIDNFETDYSYVLSYKEAKRVLED